MISDQQRKKIDELQRPYKWAAEQIIIEAQRRGHDIVYQEAYRTMERQLRLFAKGRDGKEIVRLFNYGYISGDQRNALLHIMRDNPWLGEERVVTWTLRSKHYQRLAIDIKPINFSFDELKEIAAMFGVTQPIRGDRFHHEFQRAKIKPLSLSVMEKIKRAKRGIARTSGKVKAMLQRRLYRLRQRLR